MTECPLLKDCGFFSRVCEGKPSSTDFLVKKFCKSTYESCARYYVCQEVSREAVPPCLFPDEMNSAEKIVRNYRRSATT